MRTRNTSLRGQNNAALYTTLLLVPTALVKPTYTNIRRPTHTHTHTRIHTYRKHNTHKQLCRHTYTDCRGQCASNEWESTPCDTLSNRVCTKCTDIANSNNQDIKCTTATNSQKGGENFRCLDNFYYAKAASALQADQCKGTGRFPSCLFFVLFELGFLSFTIY